MPADIQPLKAVRGPMVWLSGDPFLKDAATVFHHEPDGLLLLRGGIIEAVGAAGTLLAGVKEPVEVETWPDGLICPGFIDTHVHYVQTGMIGGWGDQLLNWLEEYAFPAERAFADKAHADRVAELFCDQLLRNGTTSAMVFCSVHAGSVDALFEAAGRRNMRVAAGKVLMDRNAPADLMDDAQGGYDQSKALIGRWHGKGRALYAITPRFAPTSSPAQLEAAGALWREHPGVLVQTHISENTAEIAWIGELFPDRSGYFDVYAHYGLAGPGAVYAHGVHLNEDELCRCHDTGTALSHCPTSNLFLGSGHFRIATAKDPRPPVGAGPGPRAGARPGLPDPGGVPTGQGRPDWGPVGQARGQRPVDQGRVQALLPAT